MLGQQQAKYEKPFLTKTKQHNFSLAQKPQNSNNNNNNGYAWTTGNEVVNSHNNNQHNSHPANASGPGQGLSPATPPTPPVDASQVGSAINLNPPAAQTQTRANYANSVKSPPETGSAQSSTAAATCKTHDSNNNSSNNSNATAAAVAAAAAAAAAVNMPIGGVQGQNPTQGLVHWMSAVMAEHMTGQTHHDPSTAVGMHYMWNGNVDVSIQHPSIALL